MVDFLGKGDLVDMAKVIIDPGHGGNDAGDIYMDRLEKEDNLRLALAIGERLQNYYGIDVVFTRTSDIYLSQLERVNIANEEGGDLLVSIHRIIGEIPSEVPSLGFYIYNEGGKAELVANNIGRELADVSFPSYSINIRTDLPIFRRVEIPGISMGVGNLSSETDNLLFDTRFDEIADAIAKGIAESLSSVSNSMNASELTNSNRNGNTETEEIYRVQVGAFSIYNNAWNLQMQLHQMGYPAVIERRNDLYVVQIGDFINLDDAAIWENCLRLQGYNTFLITV